MAEGFNRFIASIRSMVIAISQTSDQLSENAEKSSAVMSQTSRHVISQKDDTAEVAEAILQISAIGEQTSSKAQSATLAANDAQQAANSGQRSVEIMVTSIDRLASEIQTADQVIKRLDSHSDEIGNILNVIKGIAEQTNLLALNAAIEAARAGEQGRGFAVVADEVRTLATRTQDSTAEIQRTIEQLQQGAKEAIGVIQASSDIAGKTVEHSNHANTQLQSIVNDVKTITEVNRHIEQSTAQQNSMIARVNNHIEQISKAADQTADGAQQTVIASEDLLKLSIQLRNTVKQFKV